MSKAAVAILVLSLMTMASSQAAAMDFAAHSASGVQPGVLALFATALITVAALVRAHRRYVTPRLTGGLISWAARQHGL